MPIAFIKSLFQKKDKSGQNDSNKQNANATLDDNTTDILEFYKVKRFSPLDFDIQLEENKAKSSAGSMAAKPQDLLVEHSTIPIYTGNPFSPYY